MHSTRCSVLRGVVRMEHFQVCLLLSGRNLACGTVCGQIVNMASSVRVTIAQCRGLSTSAAAYGKRNFRKFQVYGKRGTKAFKKTPFSQLDPEIQKTFDRGARPVGVMVGKKFEVIPEMIPELMVPNLEGFQLKPYVSYRAADVIQGEFGPQDLFYAVYSEKIAEDFKNGKLDENCDPLEPSKEEELAPEEASNKALSLGSDRIY